MTELPQFGELVLQWLTLTFMLIGLIGLVIPIFPGIVIIWLASLIYAVIAAVAGNMGGWDWFLFILITILMVIGSFVDNLIIAKKLRETGTPWKSIGIGYAAGLISSLFLTPLAALFIAPLALYTVESVYGCCGYGYKPCGARDLIIAAIPVIIISTAITIPIIIIIAVTTAVVAISIAIAVPITAITTVTIVALVFITTTSVAGVTIISTRLFTI
jgi:uncharacterized protein YqgC (DUF456 family)